MTVVTENSIEGKLEQFAKENNLEYVIVAERKDDKNVELAFFSEAAKKADPYNKFQHLWRISLEIMNYCRGTIDTMIQHFDLVTISRKSTMDNGSKPIKPESKDNGLKLVEK